MRGQVVSGSSPASERVELADPCDVTVCNLDDPALVTSDDHVRCNRMVPWLKLTDEPPRHRRQGADA